ncbi:MAG: acetate--CoA ligase family protein, partial [Proteobacteria bacterium]|nr:acetate--CoA ligase family protein [Pseudomonadota bacterium]
VSLPSTWSQGNPIDIVGDASPKRYSAILNILMDDPSIHTVLLMHCPTALSPSKEVFKAIIDILNKRKERRPDLFLVSPQQDTEKKILAHFTRHHIPLYSTPERAVRAFIHLLNCENEKRFIDKSPIKPLKIKEKVTKLLNRLCENKEQEWVDHHIVQEILIAYDIPVVKTEMASSPSDAKDISQRLEFPLVLKIASKDIVHKSDVGGVTLNLTSPEAVEKRAKEMLSIISSRNPRAKIDGFILQPMIPLNHGFELFMGGVRDETFGPVVIFGAGGKAIEVINDKALTLAPLSKKSALNLIQQTHIYKQLKGYRDQGPIPLDQLMDCLIKLSYILLNHPEIAELDINPLFADTKKILVLDTRMRLFLKPKEEINS